MQIRLFTGQPLFCGGEIILDDDRHHYLRNVLRLSGGEKIFLFNGKDGEFSGTVENIEKKRSVIFIDKQTKRQEHPVPVRLFFAPLKRDCTDWLVEKATELGVTELCPVSTEYTTAGRVNTDRLRTIAVEAAEQSRRLTVPAVSALRPLTDVLTGWDDLSVLLHADESVSDVFLNDALQAVPDGAPVSFLVGPEGGFSPKERQMFARYAFIRSFSLGTHILRAETAALTVLAACLCYRKI